MSKLAIDVNQNSFMVIQARDAVDWIAQLAQVGAANVRNGASRVRMARNAMMQLVDRGTALIGDDELHAIVWLFTMAQRVARMYGDTAVRFVETTARAIADTLVRTRSTIAFQIVGRALAPKQRKHLRTRRAKRQPVKAAQPEIAQHAGA
jgi:hypothetical protein